MESESPLFTVSVDFDRLDTILKTMQTQQEASEKHIEYCEQLISNQTKALEDQKLDFLKQLYGTKELANKLFKKAAGFDGVIDYIQCNFEEKLKFQTEDMTKMTNESQYKTDDMIKALKDDQNSIRESYKSEIRAL